MDTEKKPSHDQNRPSFFQNTQKLTFALGLSWGIAVMAVIGLILVSVRGTGGNTGTELGRGGGGDATAATDTSNSGSAGSDASQFDPVAIAKAINLNESKFKSCLDSGKYTQRVDKDLTAGNDIGVNGTPTSFVNGTAISGALPYAQIKTAIDAALAGTKGTANVPEVTKDDHVIGGKNPKVYIIEYSDFQCPFCKRFHPTLQQALQEYGDKIAWVYRHFPLESIHPYARKLAEGSECAFELGGNDTFWDYADKVFVG